VTPSAVTRQRRDDPVRVAARALLTFAVRGRRERGGPWGEAVLGEFEQTRGRWEAMRWAAGGIRAALRERRGIRRELPRTRRWARRVAAGAALSLVLAVVTRTWLVQLMFIPSGSMEPTLTIGDRIAVDQIGFRFTGLDRGDVVVYHVEVDGLREQDFVKRVVGLPGDTIACRDGKVLRNGAVLGEPYLPQGSPDIRAECAPATVPAGHLYVLGDHRVVSRDSRQTGAVPMGDVRGRVLGVVWSPS
jgi:signal peptidase I